MRISIYKQPVSLALLSVLAACASPQGVVVEERPVVTVKSQTERIGGNKVTIVRPGDTLYAIAFEYGLDVNLLGQWNGISDSRKLAVGRRLRLSAPSDFIHKTKKPVAGKKVKATMVKRKKTATIKPPPVEPQNWKWPTTGTIVTRFNPAQGKQGIFIRGRAGQPVLATRSGQVVYVGNGLKGYGNLIIIKHSEHYLSAYAHNAEYFVKEGEQITLGRRIATMGEYRGKPELEFQIRRDGEPVDPEQFLNKL